MYKLEMEENPAIYSKKRKTKMSNLTHGSKLKVEGVEFEVQDLRDLPTMAQDDGSYYASKRSIMVTADGQGDREDYSEAIQCKNGDTFWVDGALYHLVVLDLQASDGISFITDATYKAVARAIESKKEQEVEIKESNEQKKKKSKSRSMKR